MAVQALAYHDLGNPENTETTLQRAKADLARFQEWAINNGDWGHSAEVLIREADAKINGKTDSN